MDATLLEIKNAAEAADTNTRRKMIRDLHRLADSLEDPEDTVNRVGYLVRSSHWGQFEIRKNFELISCYSIYKLLL